MTITIDELNKIEDGFQYSAAASYKMSELLLQKILGRIDVGDYLVIEDVDLELKTLEEFKKYATDNHFSFGQLDFNQLLRDWRKD